MDHTDHTAHTNQAMPHRPYRRLLIMALLSFLSMYVLMYMMVDRSENVYPNLNQAYMAGMMTAPMIVIELLLMGAMYPNKKMNAGILAASVALGLLFIAGIRTQAFVGDTQLIKSMVPHHAGAILMCEEASLQDVELQKLCEIIVPSQQSEIDWMQARLQQK
jgi:uncharacterized protein (DUF305 family)